MNKLWGCLLIFLMNGVSLAEVKYTSKDGSLVLPDVNVDDQSFWDSVTLKLDMNKGTFTLVDSKPRFPTTSDQPLQKVSSEGYDVGFLGCARTGEIKKSLVGKEDLRELSCTIQVVNNNKADKYLGAYAGVVSGNDFVDNFSEGNFFSEVQSGDLKSPPLPIGEKSEVISVFLPQSQPVRISYKIWVDVSVTSLLRFMPRLDDGSFRGLSVQFKNIKF